MKAMIKLLSAVIGGTVMAATLMGGMESIGFDNTPSITVSAAKAEKVYDGKAALRIGEDIKCKKGEEVSVPVYMGLDKAVSPRTVYKVCFSVTYDKAALTLTGVKKGSGLTGAMYGRSGNTIMFMAARGGMKVNSSKPICSLKFKVSDTAADDTYHIGIADTAGSGNVAAQIIHKHSAKKGNTYLTPYISSGSALVGEVKKLGDITGFTADISGETSWEPVENAVYYRVTRVVDGKAFTSGKITETSYTMSSMPDSKFYVYVTAYDAKENTVESEHIVINNVKPLGIPTNISVTDNGVVTWEAAENAAYYTVTKVCNGTSAVSGKINGTSYTLSQVPDGEYEVYVMSYDNKDCFLVSEVYKATPSGQSGNEEE